MLSHTCIDAFIFWKLREKNRSLLLPRSSAADMRASVSRNSVSDFVSCRSSEPSSLFPPTCDRQRSSVAQELTTFLSALQRTFTSRMKTSWPRTISFALLRRHQFFARASHSARGRHVRTQSSNFVSFNNASPPRGHIQQCIPELLVTLVLH